MRMSQHPEMLEEIIAVEKKYRSIAKAPNSIMKQIREYFQAEPDVYVVEKRSVKLTPEIIRLYQEKVQPLMDVGYTPSGAAGIANCTPKLAVACAKRGYLHQHIWIVNVRKGKEWRQYGSLASAAHSLRTNVDDVIKAGQDGHTIDNWSVEIERRDRHEKQTH